MKKYFIAVSGQPNCGKSTMFNAITGGTARVGNYPGISVDRTEGNYSGQDFSVHLVDLPGTYSLTSYSMEEVVARDVIVDEKPDAVINILDASALERSLYLAVQIMEMGIPVVLGLNMMDEVRKKGMRIDTKRLSQKMGIPAVECVARIGEGREELMIAGKKAAEAGKVEPLKISYGNDLDPLIEELTTLIEEKNFMTEQYVPRWLAIKYIEEDEIVIANGREVNSTVSQEIEDKIAKISKHIKDTLDTYPEAILSDYRYGYINGLLKDGIVTREDSFRIDTSQKIDEVLTQKFLGPIIMVAIMFAMFYITFTLGATPQGWVEDGFGWLSNFAGSLLPDGLLKSMIVSGVIDGVGAVMGFTPLILIMFSMLVFLEDLGYMARVAYMVDRVFRFFGLHGMSVMPFVMAGGLPGGCAVPGVMAARTLRSPRERIATILTSPFMICGAKTTAYIMLIGAFFPNKPTTMMFLMVLIAWIISLLVSKLLRGTVLKGSSTPFVMELPPYRLPTLRGVAIHTWERVWQYIKKAGTVILVISIIMWTLMTFPQLNEKQNAPFDTKITSLTQESKSWTGSKEEIEKKLASETAMVEAKRAETALKNSYAGRMSEAISPLTKLAGFPWQANIAFVGGFAAKEVFVSTMSTAYSLGDVDPEEANSLKEKLAADPAWTMPAILSVFIFMMLYVPCMVTVAVIVRETNWKWGIFSVIGPLTFAYALSVAIYQIGTLLGAG
ncbi:MAG: ferrous iron transport protein B [Deltaproteobacteria bacterium]|nr:MAG: ferrous iron transport protein B [Deltaproteobacteria bacterium]